MISLYAAMLIALGFLSAALLLLVFLPVYRGRIERFAGEALRRRLPMTEAEITADKDRLRAKFAIEVHRLETRLETGTLEAARQRVEVNRRDAQIQELREALSNQKTSVEEHENARRVLEQAIRDRLPKVEQRLNAARQLLSERDKEIAELTRTSTRQTEALEETTRLNVQQTTELARLRAVVETRAARNRDTGTDAKFDAEVALRTELESLRAQSRDQAGQIERLQTSALKPDGERAAAHADNERLREQLARAEAELLVLRPAFGLDTAAQKMSETRIADLQSRNSDLETELVTLKAKLRSFDDAASSTSADKVAAISARAEIAALRAQSAERAIMIERLRADVASGAEQLNRQAMHFREELGRLTASPSHRDAIETPAAEAAPPARRSLADRISAPRPPRLVMPSEDAGTAHDQPADRETRHVSNLMKALNVGGDDNPSVGEQTTDAPGVRRPRLLERISGLDKPSTG